MSTEKPEAPEKPSRKSPPDAPQVHARARELRTLNPLRLAGVVVDLFSAVAKEQGGTSYVLVKEISVSPQGFTLHDAGKGIKEPVICIPWAQVEYWVPA